MLCLVAKQLPSLSAFPLFLFQYWVIVSTFFCLSDVGWANFSLLSCAVGFSALLCWTRCCRCFLALFCLHFFISSCHSSHLSFFLFSSKGPKCDLGTMFYVSPERWKYHWVHRHIIHMQKLSKLGRCLARGHLSSASEMQPYPIPLLYPACFSDTLTARKPCLHKRVTWPVSDTSFRFRIWLQNCGLAQIIILGSTFGDLF